MKRKPLESITDCRGFFVPENVGIGRVRNFTDWLGAPLPREEWRITNLLSTRLSTENVDNQPISRRFNRLLINFQA